MIFQTSDLKEKHFLNLIDSDNNIIEPLYIKGGSQLKSFGHSNFLYTRALREITNHIPIGEYRLRFFPREEFSCPCGLYSIKKRYHILHECKRFNRYQNLRRDLISHFVMFFEFNLGMFAFQNTTIQSALSRSLSQYQLVFLSLFSFLFSSFLFSLLSISLLNFSCSIVCFVVCSYDIATTVYLCTLCNKLLN